MKYTKLIAVLSVVALLVTFTFVLLHRPHPAQAQAPAGVYGYVIEYGQPVSGRTVKLWTTSGGCNGVSVYQTTTTNDQGYYQLFWGNGTWIVDDVCQSYCVTVNNNQIQQDFDEHCNK